MKIKAMLFYPSGPIYQRGEDRSQGNISSSAATVMRAPNDMGYVSAILKKNKFEVFFKDYQTELISEDNLISDFKEQNPDLIVVSTTNSTLIDDLKIINKLKLIKTDIITVLKGAIFFNPDLNVINKLNLSNVDYLVGSEIEFVIEPLIKSVFFKEKNIDEVSGILFKRNNEWCKTTFGDWFSNIDELPFPDRSIIKNHLYVRPDTGTPQATIVTSRGCPAACTYCLTPVISGKTVRFRSPENILNELRDCYFNHNIKDFFFRSDTFTIDKKWVTELCTLIINSELHKKIRWVANSRVKPLAEEVLPIMKKAGCWLVAFGFESGSEETLKRIKKGATTRDNLRAAKLTKLAGLKLYGFFLIGLPWEDRQHISETEKHIFDINADFIELHKALPYHGTSLYDETKEMDLLEKDIIGQNYFDENTVGTQYLTSKELVDFRKKIMLSYHLRPSFILKKFLDVNLNFKVLYNYIIFGYRVIKSNITFNFKFTRNL